MRKIQGELRLLLKKRQQALLHKQGRAAKMSRLNDRISKQRLRKFRERHAEYFRLKEQREHFRRQLYRGSYTKPPAIVEISGDFGIEDSGGIDYFLDRANAIIDFKNTQLTLKLTNCTRVWPSAITLLCSLMQWVELSTRMSKRPLLGSTASSSDKVNSYLDYSGFYNYVKRPPDNAKQDYYSDKEIVKIQRETLSSNIEPREDKIVGLLEQFSALTSEQIELFNCKVLTETFNNVTEHGVSYHDRGWWVLAQYHKTHGIISLCIADNGIGIRNTLMTGPQAADISKKIDNTHLNDGQFIKMAIEEIVSGALEAPLKSAGIFTKKYESGAHRGNGLKRISDTCKNLSMPFAILSHHGYAFLDKNGNIVKNGSMPNRVFAGTFCHFLIPARKEI